MFQIVPINMITTPNFYTVSKDSFWTVTANVATTLWAQLQVSDDLGVRPYTPANGATLQVIFPRGDNIGYNTQVTLGVPASVPPTITVTKNAAVDNTNGSLFQIGLSNTDATNIISGSIFISFAESGKTYKWNQNFFVKKLNTGNGF